MWREVTELGEGRVGWEAAAEGSFTGSESQIVGENSNKVPFKGLEGVNNRMAGTWDKGRCSHWVDQIISAFGTFYLGVRLGVCTVNLHFLHFFFFESGSFFLTSLALNSSSTFATWVLALQVCVTMGSLLWRRPCYMDNQHCSSWLSSTSGQQADEFFPLVGVTWLSTQQSRANSAWR